MLAELQAALDAVRRRRQAQEKIVQDLTAPLRELQALQAEESELAAKAEAVAQQRAELNAEVERIDSYLARWAGRRARLKTAQEIIRDVEESEQLYDFYGLTAADMNTVWRGIGMMLERLEHQQNKRVELLRQLEELK